MRGGAGVVNPGSGIAGERGTGGDGSGRKGGERVDAGRDFLIAGVLAEVDARESGRDCGKQVAGRDEVEVNRPGAGSFIDDAERKLSGGCGLILVFEDELLQAGYGIPDKDGVLSGRSESGFGEGEDLSRSCSRSGDGKDAGSDGDVGGDGTKAEIVGDRVVALVDVDAGRVGRGVDDANLRSGGAADDGLATGEHDQQCGGCRETSEMKRVEEH